MTTHHIYLSAPGATPADIRRFYGQALGLREAETPPSLAHVAVLWFEAGPVKFHIGYPPGGVIGDGHVALAVPDVAAARTQVAAHGGPVEDAVIPMGYDRFYTQDPWGNRFEILPEGLP